MRAFLLVAAIVAAESAAPCQMSYDDVLATCREARGGFAWTCERLKMTTTCPTIEVNLQCDWNATDGPAAIKNKPDLTALSTVRSGTTWINVLHDGNRFIDFQDQGSSVFSVNGDGRLSSSDGASFAGGVSVGGATPPAFGVRLDMDNAGDADIAIEVIDSKAGSSETQLLINVHQPAEYLKFADFQVQGIPVFSVDKNGSLTSGSLTSGGASFAPKLSGSSGVNLNMNNAGVGDTAIEVMGKTGSDATQLLINVPNPGQNSGFVDFQADGISKFKVDKDGSLTSGSIKVEGKAGSSETQLLIDVAQHAEYLKFADFQVQSSSVFSVAPSGVKLDMANAEVTDTAIIVEGKAGSFATQLSINLQSPGTGSRFVDFQANGISKFKVDKDGGVMVASLMVASLQCPSATAAAPCCVMVDENGDLKSGPCGGSEPPETRRQLAAGLGDQVTANHAALAQVVNQQANEIAELKKLVHELLQKTP